MLGVSIERHAIAKQVRQACGWSHASDIGALQHHICANSALDGAVLGHVVRNGGVEEERGMLADGEAAIIGDVIKERGCLKN